MRNPSKNTVKWLQRNYSTIWAFYLEKSLKPEKLLRGGFRKPCRRTLDIARRVLEEIDFKKSFGFYSVKILNNIESNWEELKRSGLGEPFKLDSQTHG